MNSRSISSVFRCSDFAVRIAGRGISNQQRCFSNTSIRLKHGAVPKFTEVSSPELQELLTNVREKIFLPTHLSKEQRDLIFMAKYREKLATDPAKAIIAGEEFTLKPIDVTKDRPGQWGSLYKALLLMPEAKDWTNLPNLLEGLKTAGFKIERDHRFEIVVRKLCQNGQHGILLECLRRAEETGLTLTDPLRVIQIFFFMQQKAFTSGWDAEDTKKALAWAEMVKELMQEPKHRLLKDSEPVANLFEINGILLELAAVRAAKHQDGKDVDGKVEKYARELLASPRDFEARRDTSLGMNGWLSWYVPAGHGLKLAQTVLGPSSDLSVALGKVRQVLDPLLLTAKDELAATPTTSGHPRIGVTMYEKTLGPKAL
ncbi:hypothetical protein VTL71DRAFT_5767 [Oculimacula yallundae]|uniref:Uncharacterized protein n=1 Tax=Oculimacula yallundae TaxID=86028 RepID=A0ABR4BYH2_9HELO